MRDRGLGRRREGKKRNRGRGLAKRCRGPALCMCFGPRNMRIRPCAQCRCRIHRRRGSCVWLRFIWLRCAHLKRCLTLRSGWLQAGQILGVCWSMTARYWEEPEQKWDKFDSNNDASNKLLNFLEFCLIFLNFNYKYNSMSSLMFSCCFPEVFLIFLAVITFFVNGLRTDPWTDGRTKPLIDTLY